MKKFVSEEAALTRLADYCARGERCASDLMGRLVEWEIPEDGRRRIMEYLHTERYYDDERYAHLMARDRIRFGKWGRRKVDQALWQKHIAEDVRRRVLDGIDDEEYLNVLKPLLKNRRRTIKAANDYELRNKLVRYALGRGFSIDIIRQCIDVDDDVDYEADCDET